MTDQILSLLGGASIFSDTAMLVVFFLYGLGFIVLAGVTFLKKRKIIDVDLTRSFYSLGLFGLIHGLTEWVDLSRLWVKMNSGIQIAILDYSKIILLTISFFFLMQFGINMLTIRREKYRLFRWFPLIFVIGFFLYPLS